MGDDILDKLSAEREIKTIGRIGGGGGVVMMSCDIVQEAIEEIARLREERRWIPVAECLPNVGGEDVFVAHGEWEDGSRSLNMGWWNGREWMFYISKCGMPPVTHWMPLPAPPNGGEVE